MRKPLIYENRHDTNDLRNTYNADKYQHSLGMYVQTNDEKEDSKQNLAEKKHEILDDEDKDDEEDTDSDDDSDTEDEEEDEAADPLLAPGAVVQKNKGTKKAKKAPETKPQTIEITITTGGDSYTAPTIEIKNDANNDIVGAKVVDKALNK